MTTRPGNAATQYWRRSSTLHAANLVRIVRQDGQELAITDHDRPITWEGRTYRPIVGAGMSAERREAALRPGNQEFYGLIDGVRVTIPDLHGERYRGAEVFHAILDWRHPNLAPIARHRKFIRSVSWNGSAFTGSMESRAQMLERSTGGRYGGSFTPTCPYKLGGIYCKKNISALRQTAIVESVTAARMAFECDAAIWSTNTSNDYYRDGDVEWRWGPRNLLEIDRGLTNGAGSSTVLVDSTQAWTVNEHVGRRLITTGPAWDGSVVEFAYITANTATTLTLGTALTTFGSGIHFFITGRGISSGATSNTLTDTTQAWTVDEHAGRMLRILSAPFGAVLADSEILSNTATRLTIATSTGYTGSGLVFDIAPKSDNWGTVSPVVRHVDGTRELTLLYPTPFDIEEGDGGWLNVGCDGLRTTCIGKFNNVLNFGGDPFAPSGQEILEPPEDS